MMRSCLVAAVLAVLARRRGAAAFGQQASTVRDSGSTEAQCLVGFQVGLPKACGNLALGQAAPPVANCVCQQAVLAWWPKCKAFDVFNTLDTTNSNQITQFYDACKQRSTPTCGACSGHASAKDRLPTDKHVLAAGSPQSDAFASLFVGEMANLLQVHLNSVTPAASDSVTWRILAETGAKISLQVAWTVDATTAAEAQSLVDAGQKAIGFPAMGRRRQLQTGAQCVVGQNKGALLATATAVDTYVDKADSGFGGLPCAVAIARLTEGCADPTLGKVLTGNCRRSCGKT